MVVAVTVAYLSTGVGRTFTLPLDIDVDLPPTKKVLHDMVSKQAVLKALLLYGRSSAVASPFDGTADHVTWDDTTYTLTSSRPNPGAHQAWLPQSNG